MKIVFISAQNSLVVVKNLFLCDKLMPKTEINFFGKMNISENIKLTMS